MTNFVLNYSFIFWMERIFTLYFPYGWLSRRLVEWLVKVYHMIILYLLNRVIPVMYLGIPTLKFRVPGYQLLIPDSAPGTGCHEKKWLYWLRYNIQHTTTCNIATCRQKNKKIKNMQSRTICTVQYITKPLNSITSEN